MRSNPRLAIPLVSALIGAGAAGAGAPFLVADLGREPTSSQPAEFVELDGRMFFAATRQLSGRELWVSDGTADGTRMLADVYPGQGSADPSDLTVLGDRLWFSAADPDHGRELWTSDGTEQGTVLVRDVYPGPEGSHPDQLVALGGRLFFAARDDADDRELWVSDGTAAGTRLLKDLEPDNSSSPRQLTVWRDRLLFVAYTESLGREPWISDGTADGTRLLLDVRPGSLSGVGQLRILEHGDRFYFEGRDGSDDRLFVSDGTLEGTAQLDLQSADDPPDPRLVGIAGDRLVFASDWPRQGVWAGKDGVYERLQDLLDAGDAVAVGDELFLAGYDPVYGRELWRTDGTSAGTRLVADLVPGDESWTARPLLYEGGRLWFTTDFESALWVFDDGGTSRLTPRVSEPRFRLGRMWFAGSDAERGSELWSSDGTAAGTGLFRDVNELGSGSWEYVRHLVPFGDRMFLLTEGELWLTDGSESGTFQVPSPAELYRIASPATRPRLGDKIFFTAGSSETGVEIWWSDGERIELLADLAPGNASTRVLDLESTGRRAVFATGDEDVVDLWSTTGETVKRVLRLRREGGKISGPVPSIDPLGQIVPLGETTLTFLGWSLLDDSRQETLWRSDGTAAGTVRVTSVRRPSGASAAAGGFVYFFQLNDLFERELWRSDGRGAGTRPVATLPPETYSAGRLQPAGDRVAFETEDTSPGRRRWWVSDGTAEGTRPVLDRQAQDVAAAGGRLFVDTFGDPSQRQLWQLDADTLAVEDVIDLDADAAMFAWGEVLYYSREGALWRTDGTPEGTVRLGGPVSTNPTFQDLAAAGGLFYFQADDGLFGSEMWAVAPECIASREVLCLGGRFQARVRWRTPAATGAGRPATVGSESGTFSFFGDDFPEIALEVLDGRALNGHFWALSGTASDLEVDLRLFDSVTGDERRHFHPPGDASTIADFAAFADTPSPASTAVPAGGPAITVETRQEAADACRPDATTLCLAADRFALSVAWRDPAGKTGAGTGREITGTAGSFVFFGGDNLELLVKVLDGRALNHRFWVYAASLTDVEYALTVKDTVTGAVRVYRNPPGRLGGFGDAGAFSDGP